MDFRQIVRMLAAGRVAIGASLVVLPGFAGGFWIGAAAKDPRTKVMIRAMGIRDLALGAGLLRALDRGEPAKGWAMLGAASDAVDVAATAAGARSIGLLKAIPTIAVAATSAVAHTAALDELD
jgi:hypothetical protein